MLLQMKKYQPSASFKGYDNIEYGNNTNFDAKIIRWLLWAHLKSSS